MENNQNTNNTEVADSLTLEEAKKLIAKTIFCMIVGLAIFGVMFTILFPYTSMQIYFNMNNNIRTFEMAERVVASDYDLYLSEEATESPTATDRFTDAVYLAINISSNYMNDYIGSKGIDNSITIKWANEVKYYTDIYVKFSAKFSARDTAIEEAYRELLSSKWHADFYDNENIILSNRAKAYYITGNLGDLYNELRNDFFNMMPSAGVSFASQLSATKMNSYARTFSQLNALVSLELADAGFNYISSDNIAIEDYILNNNVKLNDRFNYLYAMSYTEIGSSFVEGKSLILSTIEEYIFDITNYIDNFNDSNFSISDSEIMLVRAYWSGSISKCLTNIKYAINIFNFYRGYGTVAEINAMQSAWSGTASGIEGDPSYSQITTTATGGDRALVWDVEKWYGFTIDDYINA